MNYLNKFMQNTVTSICYTGDNLNEVIAFAGASNAYWNPLSEELWLETETEYVLVEVGSQIVKTKVALAEMFVAPVVPQRIQLAVTVG